MPKRERVRCGGKIPLSLFLVAIAYSAVAVVLFMGIIHFVLLGK